MDRGRSLNNEISQSLKIRGAEREDVSLILSFVRELAEYERAPDAVRATEGGLLRDGFGANPRFRCLIAEWNGEPAGFALFFYNYSTWEGRAGIYLEDLFVRPPFRKLGIGRALFAYLSRLVVEEDLGRLVWQVLDWNQPAIDFYKSLGAERSAEWLTMRLSGKALRDVASSASFQVT
jgi:GNAT superfamily N-acetyltransferase